MKSELQKLMKRIEECCSSIDAADQVATATAQRLDSHMEASRRVHQDLRGRLAVLEEHVQDLLRRVST